MPKNKINIIAEEIEKKNYHLFVDVKIGKKNSRLLVDTGASKTVFDSHQVLKFVKKKKLKIHSTKSVGLGVSEVETKVVKLKGLKFGQLEVSKMEVAVLDLSHVNQSYSQLELPNIDGVLGSDFLMNYKAVINYKKLTILLES